MSVPQIFEVAIGLVVIYYILGTIVSTVTQIVTESLQTVSYTHLTLPTTPYV